MNRGLAGILIVAGLLAAAYAYWLSSHKRPIGRQDVISVVLSVDDNGDCVQSGEKDGVVSIPEGESVEYSTTDPKIPFSVNFGPAGVISTGSPFPSAAGAGWQLQFTSAGGPASTMPSKLTFPEWALRAFGTT